MEFHIQKMPEGGYLVFEDNALERMNGMRIKPLYASFMLDDALAFIRKKMKEGEPETAMERQSRLMQNSAKPWDIIPVDSDMRPTGNEWDELP